MIHMEAHHLEIVRDILKKHPYTFYAFGSRVKGTQKKFSDLDLCFMEHISWSIRSKIEEEFEESDLPFKVDIVDWNMCDESFRALIAKDMVLFQK